MWHNFFLQKFCDKLNFKYVEKLTLSVVKKSQSLSSLLGLTQDELALILKVDRSRFAKYEAGSRDIPLTAKQLLAEMIQYSCGPTTEEKSTVHMAAQQAQKEKAVQKMLKENEYQQMATERKITSVETKYTSKLKALQLVEFLSLREDKKETTDGAILRSIAYKASQILKTQGLDLLFKLKLKLEMLQLEKMLLDAEIRKIRLATENTSGKA
ncbi:hypothetical protein [Flavobacterium sangjuense]|uniref:Uncharacterized protein n=1 Tax=Flavobacterium sangjuense TaxID=2518177 RepID=A0A4P7PV59_9FLAO|nr:hypothetical protein [Flavobacterium sangjuense]QBZ98849.1 hypothetical protein GS03_02360 [Flavobacterium sangjuense]